MSIIYFFRNISYFFETLPSYLSNLYSWVMANGMLLILIFLSAGAFLGLFILRIHENRYLKKKTSEVFSKEVAKEIEQERAENVRKKEKFEESLKRFNA